MSALAASPADAALVGARDEERIKQNIKLAREHRKKFEPVWQSNLAFAAGQHWLVWSDKFRALRRIQDIDPRYRNRELYQADVITEIRTHVLGELGSDDDRPELLLQRDDRTSEDYQGQVNRAVGYGWDFEWDGDTAMNESDRYCVDLGTSAVQVYFDPSFGPVKAESVPHENGQPILDPEQAVQKVAQAFLGGETLQYKSINEGRICWHPLSSFNLLPPPGVTHEKFFPWECVVAPIPIADLKATYGDAASEIREDRDIASSLGEIAVGPSASGYATSAARKGTLRNHVWLFRYYQRPTPQNPKGRVYHFAGNDLKHLRTDEELPYKAPDGTYRSGISYFHWWRVTGRFWSRSLIESIKDQQRTINKRRSQMNEIIDRGLPYTLVQTGSQAKKRTDLPMEIVEIDRSEQAPVHVQGTSPGSWWYQELEQIQGDLERASGVRVAALGENPPNVVNYSQLALLREADQVKRSTIYRDRKSAIANLIENSVYDIRRYWGHEKQIMLAGEEDEVEAETFNASKIPDFFIVKVAKGAAKPRSQAAELQKVQDIWNAVVTSGAVQADPQRWIEWFKESLDHGEVMDLPDIPSLDQIEKAERENHLLLVEGVQVPVAYYDPPDVHIPIHRKAQIEAEYAHDLGAWQRIEQHVQEHLAAAQENMTVTQGTQAGSLLAASQQQAQAQAPSPPSEPQTQGAPSGPQEAQATPSG